MTTGAAPSVRARLEAALGESLVLERELGGGGMSVVFVARESALERRVAVKVLSPELTAAVDARRFRREILLAARLQHPHVVPVLRAGDADGLPYFVMPYVEGESLRERLARSGALPLGEGVRVLRGVAAALAYAHRQGVVHRDIKPDNVLLSQGSPVLTDFGVARALLAAAVASSAHEPRPAWGGGGSEDDGHAEVGFTAGTPAYMAPEQAAADPAADHRMDIYAFGVLAYELFTGALPFPGRSGAAMLAAHVAEPPPPVTRRRADLPPRVASLVMHCLEKDPAHRPSSADYLVAVLDALLVPGGEVARVDRAERASQPHTAGARGQRGLLAAGGVAALLVGALAWWRVGAGDRAVAAPERARVVLAAFGGAGADPVLTGVLAEAVRTDLGASERVAPLPPPLVERALASLCLAPGTPLDAAIARRVALRAGVPVAGVVEGRVTNVGGVYAVALTLADARSGETLAAYRETADGLPAVMPAVNRAVEALRERAERAAVVPAGAAGDSTCPEGAAPGGGAGEPPRAGRA